MDRIDAIGARLAASPRVTERLFRDGWGDLPPVRSLLADRPDIKRPPFEAKPIGRRNGWLVTDWRFTSSYDLLPDASATAYLRTIEPPGAERVVLLMAAFNDHGYETRQSIGRHLLRRGMAVAVLENPYYGLRRPQQGQPMRTAADLLSMGVGAVWDGIEVATWLGSRRPWTVGVAGYSMGANTAALVSAVSPGPIACAALAASHSPGPVFTVGALGGAVDWDALGGDPARSELSAIFGEASVLRFAPAPHTGTAVILGIRNDGYVPTDATRALADHWPGAELWWADGGHASVLWNHKRQLAGLIERSFDRLEQSLATAPRP